MAVRKVLENAYGFDDVAIVPGAVTTNPELVTTEFTLGERTYSVPIWASRTSRAVAHSSI